MPQGTPEPIRRALMIAASCQFCTFVSPLENAPSGEYAIEAWIGPSYQSLDDGAQTRPPWYKVRLLIPPAFPFATVHAVPLEPPLRWWPHQDGDWPLDVDPHANVLCPTDLNQIHMDELLLPHIRHAYAWIADATSGTLIQPGQRYEFPHLVRRSMAHLPIYLEGGREMLDWLQHSPHWGRAWVHRVQTDKQSHMHALLRVVELQPPDTRDAHQAWRSRVRDGAFGVEELEGWAPWVFVGPPVAEQPHRPYVRWEDFPEHMQRRIVRALHTVGRYEHRAPFLLLAFRVPERWSGGSERAVWTALELDQTRLGALKAPHGFRPQSDMLRWPSARALINQHNPLPWIGRCTDVSSEALTCRSRSGAGQPAIAQQGSRLSQAFGPEHQGSMRTQHPSDGSSELAGEDVSANCDNVGVDISDLRIAIIGVGALGSMLAKGLDKLGPAELLLIDKENLEPGNLVRHEALPIQVETGKASAMATLLQPVTADRKVRRLDKNVVDDWDEVKDDLASCDLIIDATADSGVHMRLLVAEELVGVRLAWCYAKPGPDFGVLVLRRANSTLTMEAAEDALRAGVSSATWDRFVGAERGDGRLVWPEPGCYVPTFNAPYHRLRMLADGFISVMESWLAAGSSSDVITLVIQEEPVGKLGVEQRIAAQVLS